MTEEQRAEISRLAEIAHDAERRLHWASYGSVSADPEEARASAVRYALLRAEAYEARGALEAAISALGTHTSGGVRLVANALATGPRLDA